MTKPQTIQIATQSDLGAPWSYFVEAVLIEEEDAGQGSHPPYPLIAMLSCRAYNAEMPFEVAVGGIDKIDALINALTVTKERIKVEAAEQKLNQLRGHLARVEAQLL